MPNSPFLIVPFEVKQVTEDDSNYIVEGFASTYGNVDLGDDMIMPGAFTETLAQQGSKRSILWQHSIHEPIGSGEFSDMTDGLMVKCYLPKSDTFVSGRVMPQVKIGSIHGMSIGYAALDYEYEDRNGRRIRKLKRIELYEVSLVTFPMDQHAVITAAKQFLADYEGKEEKAVPPYSDAPIADSGTKWDGNQAVKDARSATGSEEKPSATYKDWFFYYDPGNADSFGGYKLPKFMMIDGKKQYVPKGLAAVVGALSGARGGISIPEADKTKIKSQLNRLYKKMGREEPFSKGMSLLDVQTIKAMEPIDLERIFDNDVVLSRSAKEYVAGAVSGKGIPDNSEVKNESNDLHTRIETLRLAAEVI